VKIHIKIGLAAFMCSANIFAASFDCSKTKSRSEIIICSDPEISRLEEEFTILYKKAREVVSDREAFNRENRAEWKWRETACIDSACLAEWFYRRNERLLSITRGSSKVQPTQNVQQEDAAMRPPQNVSPKEIAGQERPGPDYSADTDALTDEGAVICPMALFFNMRQDRGPREIYEAFTATWNREEKIRYLGCDEWQGGIKVVARRMSYPYQDFIAVKLSRDVPATLFTMAPYLRN
jgi:hypothetical protein